MHFINFVGVLPVGGFSNLTVRNIMYIIYVSYYDNAFLKIYKNLNKKTQYKFWLVLYIVKND